MALLYERAQLVGGAWDGLDLNVVPGQNWLQFRVAAAVEILCPTDNPPLQIPGFRTTSYRRTDRFASNGARLYDLVR